MSCSDFVIVTLIFHLAALLVLGFGYRPNKVSAAVGISAAITRVLWLSYHYVTGRFNLLSDSAGLCIGHVAKRAQYLPSLGCSAVLPGLISCDCPLAARHTPTVMAGSKLIAWHNHINIHCPCATNTHRSYFVEGIELFSLAPPTAWSTGRHAYHMRGCQFSTLPAL